MTVRQGDIVWYTLTENDAKAITASRGSIIEAGRRGNSVTEGDTLPAMLVRAWSDGFWNVQVFLDGNDTYWATSVTNGMPDEPGRWVTR